MYYGSAAVQLQWPANATSVVADQALYFALASWDAAKLTAQLATNATVRVPRGRPFLIFTYIYL